jgi:hypothetical protein
MKYTVNIWAHPSKIPDMAVYNVQPRIERLVAALWRVLEFLVFGLWRFIAWTVGGFCVGWFLCSLVGGVYFDTAVVVAVTGAILGFGGRVLIEIVHLVAPTPSGDQERIQ